MIQVAQQYTNGNNCQTATQWSPYSNSSISQAKQTEDGDSEDDLLANIGLSTSGNGGDGDGGEPGGNGGDNNNTTSERFGNSNSGKKGEFILVNFRNVTITPFSGRNLQINPYMRFNNSTRRLILPQGFDGEVLLKMFDKVEARGANKYDNNQLQILINKFSKAAEFDTFIKSASLNWTTGVANNMIKYSVHNGFDAWRKLYHRYVLLVEDLQNISIQELMCLKFHGEGEIGALFNEIERIIDLYVKTGPTDALSDRWIRAAIMEKNTRENRNKFAHRTKTCRDKI